MMIIPCQHYSNDSSYSEGRQQERLRFHKASSVFHSSDYYFLFLAFYNTHYRRDQNGMNKKTCKSSHLHAVIKNKPQKSKGM